MQDTARARQNMVNCQILTNKLTDDRITEALLAVPRENFVPKGLEGVAYIDENIPLGDGRYLMEPMIFARLVQAAEIAGQDVVLDVACGSGYSTAVLARLAGAVVALEADEGAVAAAEQRLAHLAIDNAAVVAGELSAGYPDQGPFDVIIINGAVASLPAALPAQLADGGRLLVVERQGVTGCAVLYLKTGETVSRRELFDAQLPMLPGFEAAEAFVF
ncbi:MAG: protein-L-isoaspartate O-methyltransferase [Alphaproteobacteria bacterium]|jgi:protein-L-isoaspartate(D-aspartate) O-methyltransferase|nr:protein-L-isoaspartate O-methyltransferase [Alphaproteobacteria bacterium]MDP6564614.1 protein-L-isoaspartate O-methyltransferase [Alphaproteobacteria bacterium]MDP6816048.1 protein-L-isoaspartate O-methyltransferase [Alphaproteobacteria bacterium]